MNVKKELEDQTKLVHHLTQPGSNTQLQEQEEKQFITRGGLNNKLLCPQPEQTLKKNIYANSKVVQLSAAQAWGADTFSFFFSFQTSTTSIHFVSRFGTPIIGTARRMFLKLWHCQM